jgi:hypothetical protein
MFDADSGRLLSRTADAGYAEGVVVTGGAALVVTRDAPGAVDAISTFVGAG